MENKSKESKSQSKQKTNIDKIIQNISVGIYIRSFKNDVFKYEYMNERAKEFYGNNSLTESVYWNQEEEDEYDRKCLVNNTPCTFEKPLLDKDGHIFRWLEVHKIKNLQGNTCFITTTLIDITSRKNGMDELMEQQRILTTAAEKESFFFANIEREIRTPLNAILGFSNLLVETENRAEKEQYNHIIAENAEFLFRLFTNLQDITQLEAGRFKFSLMEFDLTNFLMSFYHLYQAKMNENVHLLINNKYEYCFIEFDKDRLTQIITQFLENAWKYTSQGTIELAYEVTKTGITISIKDSGQGIDKEQMEHLYDRYSPVHTYASPTALSLAINKSIIDAAGGTLEVESEKGKGTTFTLHLPCKVTRAKSLTD